MFNLVVKDFLTLSKNKSDFFQLILMPFILIAILGFALGEIIMTDSGINTFHVGIVNQQTSEEDLQLFEEHLREEGFPEPAVSELTLSAQEVDPVKVLKEILQDEEMAEIMAVQEYSDSSEAIEAMEADEIEGYILIPENFSYDFWQAVFLEEDLTASLEVITQTESSIAGKILQSVVETFADQYNFSTSVAIATGEQAEPSFESEENGEIIHLSVEEPVSSFQYYTIGMAVMFALYTAPVIAGRAFKEKEQHVFGRIMLSGMKPIHYLMSKLFSGTLITFVQLTFLFLLSTLIFGTFRGRDLDFWINMVYVTGIYSFVVGSIGSLLTAISLNSSDIATVNIFDSFISILAFLGGSFTPVEQFSEFLKEVGNWTPNGAAMTSYLQIIQGFSFNEVSPLMMRAVGMAIVAVIAAVFVFPKRRSN